MLKLAKLDAAHPSASSVTPAAMDPLVRVAERGEDLVPVVRSMINKMGFDSFLSGWASASRPDRDTLLYAFTTLPLEWTALYERNYYIEVDPRVQLVEEISALFTWSAEDLRGTNKARDRFFDDAAKFGIRSGACFGWRDREGNGVLIAYNSAHARIDPHSLRESADGLYAFGHAFHDVFMRNVIEKGVPSRLRGVALTRREIEALQYAARGLTIQDIGPKMKISPRTVRFHIDSVVTKLGALKRDEAIALAVKGGLLNLIP